MKTIFIIIFLLFSIPLFSQTETHSWKGGKINYTIDLNKGSKEYSQRGFLSVIKYGYKGLISDYDGNHCPFSPSCSEFFVEAVKQTNLLQGLLMFADRFTRDLNYFNRGNYQKLPNGKLYDPVVKYNL